ncbi:MAG: gliding motility-associated C-terminal domain-containing protein [Bacteroidales bacterium]
MKRILTVMFLLAVLPLTVFSQWQVSGGLYPVYQHTPSAASGISSVYFLYGMNHASVSFLSKENSPMRCFRFQTGALQAEEVSGQQDNDLFTLSDIQPGCGYYIEQSGRPVSYMWLIDYQPLLLQARSLSIDPEMSDCMQTRLIFEKTAPEIMFYWINGRKETVEREFILSYHTLEWNEESKSFEEILQQENVTGYREISVAAPFCNTDFTLSGDQFLRFWKIPAEVTSPLYEAVALTGKAFAEQHVRGAGNELDKETGELGGSAPVDISFAGYANYPVTTYQAWEISRDADFNIIDATYTDQNLNYSFEEEGLTYVRFVISNAMGSCEEIVNTFTINTSESSLKVPNVFTPESPGGNNRIFKVAYKSIIKFEGWVYNRWGNQVFHWTNPADGWDGTYNGKVVPTGAYFYVIEAEGVGGKKYKLKGDINVLRTRN